MHSGGGTPIKESDLYGPLREYLEALGYAVRGEVLGCDVVAERDGDIIILELKRNLSISLLIQATDRQRACASVYVVLPDHGGKIRTRQWRSRCRLLKRLELGLVLVDLSNPRDSSGAVRVIFHPQPSQRRVNKSMKKSILTELHGRSVDLNQGGTTGTKIVTAYRENAVQIACCISLNGPMAPAALRKMGTGPKTQSILSDNFYGWFQRVAHGVYDLTPKGRREIAEYPELVTRWTQAAASPIPSRPDPPAVLSPVARRL